MKCPKCGHRIPEKSDSSLYLGTWIRKKASSKPRMDFLAVSASPGKMGGNIAGIQANKEEMNSKKLEELPLSIRARVEEVLKKGDGQSEEIGTSFREILE